MHESSLHCTTNLSVALSSFSLLIGWEIGGMLGHTHKIFHTHQSPSDCQGGWQYKSVAHTPPQPKTHPYIGVLFCRGPKRSTKEYEYLFLYSHIRDITSSSVTQIVLDSYIRTNGEIAFHFIMDAQLKQLVSADLTERIRILQQADEDFINKILQTIRSARRDHYNEEEWHDLSWYTSVLTQLTAKSTPYITKARLLMLEGPWFIRKVLEPLTKKRQKRIRKDCPFPHCYKKGLLRLPNHLRQVHQLVDKKERLKWLDRARIGYKTGNTTEQRIIYKTFG